MKIIKPMTVLSFAALFAFGCSDAKTTNTTANSNKPVANSSPAAANSPAATPVDELASAKKIYSEKCIRCHKEDGTGGVTDIDGVKIKAPNLTLDKYKNEPDSEFIEAIEKGYPDDGMPAFKGKISDDDIKNLVKLIRRDIQKK
jgi:mono/diheme cytochrome c family protein